MDSQNSPQISVFEPIGEAIEMTKTILFRPFDFEKWFTIGFCAWLAILCQSSLNLSSPFGNANRSSITPEQVQNFILSNLSLVIAIGSGVLIVSIAVGIVFLWLSSRGNFMFLSCIAQNKAEIKTPWHKYRQEGNSLFLFRLVVSAISFFVFIIFAGIAVALIVTARRNGPDATALLVGGVIAEGVVLLPITLLFSAFIRSTYDFVVPIMYLHRTTCTQAWGMFWQLLKNNIGKFILYFLFQIVIKSIFFLIAMILLIVTSLCTFLIFCCCFCCITNIPLIGTTAMLYIISILFLPLLIFARSYSLCYLRQYGSGYDVFATPTPPQLKTISEQ